MRSMYSIMISLTVLIAAFSLGVHKDDTAGPALQTLVDTERAFARTCLEKGIRASFLEFFAEDGIAFRPGPVRYKEAVKDLPPQPNPLALRLEWEPQFGGIAASGELGYTTGPSVFSDNLDPSSPKHYGQFFSVWKKQLDGTWKVAVDIGIQTPTAATPLGMPFTGERRATSSLSSTANSGNDHREVVMDLERQFSSSCSSQGPLGAYLPLVDDDSRLHRKNVLPVVGREAIRSHLGMSSLVPVWSPVDCGISRAGDLGYAYGSYESKAGERQSGEKGYYLRVWRREKNDVWKIIADITNPLQLDEGK